MQFLLINQMVPSTLFWYAYPPSLIRQPSIEHHRSSPASKITPQLWWRSHVEDFQILPSSQLSAPVQSAISFKAIIINVPHHLKYLLALFLQGGGKLLKARLPTNNAFAGTLQSAVNLVKASDLPDVDVFVNATGIGAKELVPDEAMYPIKGQTVLVKGEAREAKTTDKDHYVIPRPGSETTILGGTREVGVWYVFPIPLYPSLFSFFFGCSIELCV